MRVKVGLGVGTEPPLARVRTLTRAARALRFDSVWVVDHFAGLFPSGLWDRELSWLIKPGSSPHVYFDYQALFGNIAPLAGRMQVGVGVTEPIRRHPVLLAQWAMTVAHMTKRPPILGIGAGEAMNLVPYGFDFTKPVGTLEEALQIIRRCFESSGPFDYDGEHYHLDGALMDLRPPRGRAPEVWIAAHGPRMLRLTGRYGDGWYPTFPMTPDDYAAKLAVISEAAAGAGRDPSRIVAGYQLPVVIGRTRAHARELLDSRALRAMALLVPDEVWRAAGARHPLGDGHRGVIDFMPEGHSKAELEDAVASVPLDLIETTVVWGSRHEVLTQLRGYVDAGLRHVVLFPVSGLVSRDALRASLGGLLAISRALRSG